MFVEPIEQRHRIVGAQPVDPECMLADDQIGSTGVGVDLHERAQRRFDVVEAVQLDGIWIALSGVQAGPFHAVAPRVVGVEIGDVGASACVERVVRRSRVGEPGRPTLARDDLCAEHGTFGLDRHVGAVVMPTLVAAQRLDEVVVGLAHGAVASDVGERRCGELELSEVACEGVLLELCEVLAGKDQQSELDPRLANGVDRDGIELANRHASHDDTEGGVERFDHDPAVAHRAIVSTSGSARCPPPKIVRSATSVSGELGSSWWTTAFGSDAATLVSGAHVPNGPRPSNARWRTLATR